LLPEQSNIKLIHKTSSQFQLIITHATAQQVHKQLLRKNKSHITCHVALQKAQATILIKKGYQLLSNVVFV